MLFSFFGITITPFRILNLRNPGSGMVFGMKRSGSAIIIRGRVFTCSRSSVIAGEIVLVWVLWLGRGWVDGCVWPEGFFGAFRRDLTIWDGVVAVLVFRYCVGIRSVFLLGSKVKGKKTCGRFGDLKAWGK